MMKFAQLTIVLPAIALYPYVCARADNFQDTLASAYVNNPVIRAERESLSAKDEGVSQANSGFFPTIGANGAYGPERIKYEGVPWESGDTTVRAVTLDQPIYIARTYDEYKSAKAQVIAGRAHLQYLEQQILLNAATVYLNVLEKQWAVNLSRQNTVLLGQQKAATLTRLQAGDVTATDSALSESRVARGEAEAQQASGELEVARTNYQRIVGAPALNIADLPALPPLPATLEEALADTDNNPEIAEAVYKQEAADHEIDVHEDDLLPKLSLQGNINDTSSASTVLGFSKVNSETLLLNLSIPLYQSGAEYSRVREAKDHFEQAKYQVMDTKQAAREVTAVAWYRYQTARNLTHSNETTFNAAQKALEGVREENRAGTRTTLDMLDAQQEYYVGAVGVLKAKITQWQEAYRLLAATGHMTPETLKLAVNRYDPVPHYEEVRLKRVGF